MTKVCIPKSYYLVQSPHNTFTLQEEGINTTMTLPPGNYNLKSFQLIVSAMLTERSPHGWTYLVSSYTVSNNFTARRSFTAELYLHY